MWPPRNICNNLDCWRVATELRRRGFTILEILVAMAVFAVLLGVMLSIISQSGAVWQRAQGDVGSYQSARFAFNLITRELSQSRMNVYEDYDNASSPTAYLRKSDLHFVIDAPQGTNFGQGNAIFFQAPANRTLDAVKYGSLPSLLNSVGYYISYGPNPNLPGFLQSFDRNRFRLMQFLAPTENMTASLTNGGSSSWYEDNLAGFSTVIADNVICILFWPRLSKEDDPEGDDLAVSPNGAYRYDSKQGATAVPQPVTANQQPPLVQVTLVALDKQTANRLPDTATPPPEVSSALQGLFAKATENDFKNDLSELEKRLTAARFGYRVFNSTVPLRESKWSK